MSWEKITPIDARYHMKLDTINKRPKTRRRFPLGKLLLGGLGVAVIVAAVFLKLMSPMPPNPIIVTTTQPRVENNQLIYEGPPLTYLLKEGVTIYGLPPSTYRVNGINDYLIGPDEMILQQVTADGRLDLCSEQVKVKKTSGAQTGYIIYCKTRSRFLGPTTCDPFFPVVLNYSLSPSHTLVEGGFYRVVRGNKVYDGCLRLDVEQRRFYLEVGEGRIYLSPDELRKLVRLDN